MESSETESLQAEGQAEAEAVAMQAEFQTEAGAEAMPSDFQAEAAALLSDFQGEAIAVAMQAEGQAEEGAVPMEHDASSMAEGETAQEQLPTAEVTVTCILTVQFTVIIAKTDQYSIFTFVLTLNLTLKNINFL